MKFRILPIAASLLLATRLLHAEIAPATAEATKEAAPAKATEQAVPLKPAEPPPAAEVSKEAAPAKPADAAPAAEPGKETAKPADPPKPADLPPPKPIGDAVNKGLAWLAKSQNSDGGWGQGGGWRVNVGDKQSGGRVEGDNVPDPSDIGNTAMALQAFLRSGTKLDSGEHSKVTAKAAAFLLTQLEAADDDSLYVTKVRDTQLQSKIGTYVDTFLATQVLSDLKGLFPEPSDEARRAKLLDKIVAKIQKHQQNDGGFAGNRGWAATLSQGLCSSSLNSAYAAGAKVDVAALEKDHVQNATGLDRATGAVAGGGAAADAGVEIYRYASKVGGMSRFGANNAGRRGGLEQTAASPTASPAEKAQAQQEIAKIDQADADQKVLLTQVAGKVNEAAFVKGFGNNGGEEFISFMNIGEALRSKGGDEWKKWDDSTTKTLNEAQNEDGSWAGHHCITGRTFCTSAALMVLMTDRIPAPVVVKAEENKDKAPTP